MQVMLFVTVLMWAPHCLAHVGPSGPDTPAPPAPSHTSPPGPPAAAPAPPGTQSLAPDYLKECAAGDLLPGPTCTSFLMCVGGRTYATRRVKFDCAPGTVFDPQLGICISSSKSECKLVGVAPPGTPPNTIPSPVGPTGTIACIQYQLDPTSIYECLEEGFFPSLSDCSGFYKCLITMGCTIKGFLFRCPAGYLFDNRLKRCEKEEIIGPCERVMDDVGQTHEVRPVVEIKPEKLDQFFETQTYWDFMPFMPNETQRVVPMQPSSFSRAPGVGVFMPQV
ncbi:uncharacterized protein LOC127007216 [Eriocheir sinensis]|uniref:uncharacterized protein LOC127007216 n=1 Tax=Eriocheir sinensis TaxID=95602 RepID=UPI0021C63106|nr:uncharacterized protein LOC127007216 [Eriocheir sinensis]